LRSLPLPVVGAACGPLEGGRRWSAMPSPAPCKQSGEEPYKQRQRVRDLAGAPRLLLLAASTSTRRRGGQPRAATTPVQAAVGDLVQHTQPAARAPRRRLRLAPVRR
jgi:hypothetical protein